MTKRMQGGGHPAGVHRILRAYYPAAGNDVEKLCTTVHCLIVEIGHLVSAAFKVTDDLMEWGDRALSSQSNGRNLANRLIEEAA